MTTTHKLKTLKLYFKSVWTGVKKFEVRRNDRNFKVGDLLELQEYDDSNNSYTGREVRSIIIYVLQGGVYGIDREFCVIGFKRITKIDKLRPPAAAL